MDQLLARKEHCFLCTHVHNIGVFHRGVYEAFLKNLAFVRLFLQKDVHNQVKKAYLQQKVIFFQENNRIELLAYGQVLRELRACEKQKGVSHQVEVFDQGGKSYFFLLLVR